MVGKSFPKGMFKRDNIKENDVIDTNTLKSEPSKCEVCGANVQVVGQCTQYYVNLDQEKLQASEKRVKELEKEILSHAKESKHPHNKFLLKKCGLLKMFELLE